MGDGYDIIEATPLARSSGGGARRRQVAPNWGRSYQVTPGIANSIVEFVRLEFERPHDITLMVGSPSDGIAPVSTSSPISWSWNNVAVYIELGSGGTSNTLQWRASTLGDVRHVTAQTVIARAQLPDLAEAPLAIQGKRFGITAGLGRPSTQQLANWSTVNSSITPDVTNLMPWVKLVQLSAYDTFTVAGATVTELEVLPDGSTTTLMTRPFTDFTTPQPITRFTNALSVALGSGGPSRYLLTQYWEL